MTAGEILFVFGAFLGVMLVCSLPGVLAMASAGPRYRAESRRQLAVTWAATAATVGWLAAGGWLVFGADAGPRVVGFYRDLTLVLTGAGFPLLFGAVRAGNRRLAAARAGDAGAV